MPTPEEKKELVSWVEDLPRRENISGGYGEVLSTCAAKYCNSADDLRFVLNSYTETFKRTMNTRLESFMKEHNHLPPPEVMAEMHENCMSAALLRMWTYASEYYQRWTALDLLDAMSESNLDALLQEIVGKDEDKNDQG